MQIISIPDSSIYTIKKGAEAPFLISFVAILKLFKGEFNHFSFYGSITNIYKDFSTYFCMLRGYIAHSYCLS